MNTNDNSGRAAEISRREAIRRGLGGAAGVLVADRLWADGPATGPQPVKSAAKTAGKVKAKSVIQVFLWGGMSHNDTWDPKPESGYEYMGEFAKAIARIEKTT